MTNNIKKYLNMTNYVFIFVLLISLYACTVSPMRWSMDIDDVVGTHVSVLQTHWGEPDKIGNSVYRWQKRTAEQRGGYYTTSTERRAFYDSKGNLKGYIEEPVEKYIPPYIEHNRCEVTVVVDANGLVTDIGYDSGKIFVGPLCPGAFPLPNFKP